MGRHLWRLVKPQFLWKMLRSNAASLYGWDILLAGTARRVKRLVMPMPISFVKQLNITKSACTPDHHARQAHSGNWDRQTLVDDIARGLRTPEEIIGQPVTCSAAAGWRADQQVIEAKKRSICATTAIVVGPCRFGHCSNQETPALRKFR